MEATCGIAADRGAKLTDVSISFARDAVGTQRSRYRRGLVTVAEVSPVAGWRSNCAPVGGAVARPSAERAGKRAGRPVAEPRRDLGNVQSAVGQHLPRKLESDLVQHLPECRSRFAEPPVERASMQVQMARRIIAGNGAADKPGIKRTPQGDQGVVTGAGRHGVGFGAALLRGWKRCGDEASGAHGTVPAGAAPECLHGPMRESCQF
jgi:hypothetical protein